MSSTALSWKRDLSPGIGGNFYRAEVGKLVARVSTIGIAATWQGASLSWQWSVVGEDWNTYRTIVIADGYATDEQQAFRLCQMVVELMGQTNE